MAAKTPRPPRRSVAGSRNPTARPRRVAGSREDAPVDEPVESTVDAPVESTLDAPVDEPVESTVVDAPVDEPGPEPTPEPHDETPAPRRPGGVLGSSRTTVALVAALVLLVGVAAGESWYLWLRDEPTVSSARPVVTGEMAHRAAVEAASADIEDILTTSYKNYEDQVDQATSKMTDTFAAQYRETAEQIRPEFVAAKTEVQSQVVAAGVMRASAEQVEALIFVNQARTRDGKDTTVSQYRVRMTMVHTDHGWLVSGIQTT